MSNPDRAGCCRARPPQQGGSALGRSSSRPGSKTVPRRASLPRHTAADPAGPGPRDLQPSDGTATPSWRFRRGTGGHSLGTRGHLVPASLLRLLIPEGTACDLAWCTHRVRTLGVAVPASPFDSAKAHCRDQRRARAGRWQCGSVAVLERHDGDVRGNPVGLEVDASIRASWFESGTTAGASL